MTVKETDQFLDTHSLPRLNVKEKENLNRPITSIEVEPVIKKLLRNRNPGPYASKRNSTQYLNKNQYPHFTNYS